MLGRRSVDFNMRLLWVISRGKLNTLEAYRFCSIQYTHISCRIVGPVFVSDWFSLKRAYSATHFGIILRDVSASIGLTIPPKHTI
jgi:hypothetical protein